jgi:hypothetical protein
MSTARPAWPAPGPCCPTPTRGVPYAPPAIGTHWILHAERGISGRFDTWEARSMFIEGTPRYEAQDLWLDLTHVELDQAMQAGGASPLAVAAAANVQAALDGAPGLLGPIAPLLSAGPIRAGPSAPSKAWPDTPIAGLEARLHWHLVRRRPGHPGNPGRQRAVARTAPAGRRGGGPRPCPPAVRGRRRRGLGTDQPGGRAPALPRRCLARHHATGRRPHLAATAAAARHRRRAPAPGPLAARSGLGLRPCPARP